MGRDARPALGRDADEILEEGELFPITSATLIFLSLCMSWSGGMVEDILGPKSQMLTRKSRSPLRNLAGEDTFIEVEKLCRSGNKLEYCSLIWLPLC